MHSMRTRRSFVCVFFFFQAEDGIRDLIVTGVQTCALPICPRSAMIRTRSSFDIRAWPSTPRMATSGSPGRIRRTTKMMTETPSSVPAAYAARRPRYFLTRAAPGSGLRHPDRVPPHDVVHPEVRRRVLSSHPVVPGVVDLLVGDRNQWRILLEHVLGLADHRRAPG